MQPLSSLLASLSAITIHSKKLQSSFSLVNADERVQKALLLSLTSQLQNFPGLRLARVTSRTGKFLAPLQSVVTMEGKGVVRLWEKPREPGLPCHAYGSVAQQSLGMLKLFLLTFCMTSHARSLWALSNTPRADQSLAQWTRPNRWPKPSGSWDLRTSPSCTTKMQQLGDCIKP